MRFIELVITATLISLALAAIAPTSADAFNPCSGPCEKPDRMEAGGVR